MHLYIFLASPGDVSKERKLVKLVVEELNRVRCHHQGLTLIVKAWETDTHPGYGDAQMIINEQIAEMSQYHLFVGIMWNRLGKPTERAESGTVEEFERAVAAYKRDGRPDIWFYFRDARANLKTEEEIEQRRKVLAFRKRLQPNAYAFSYGTPADFEKKFREELNLWLNRRPAGEISPTVTTPLAQLSVLPQTSEMRTASENRLEYGQAELGQSPSRWKAPPFFRGRFIDVRGVLKKLHADRERSLFVVVHGIPGVGKTQLATAYINDYKDDYTANFWVNAGSRETVLADMETIARGLQLRVENKPDYTVDNVRDWFDHPDNVGYLLVLDNANDVGLVEWLMPTARRGRILVTTNEAAFQRRADLVIKIDALPPEEGADALFQLARSDPTTTDENREVALAISRELGGLMIAIDQAAAYIADGYTPAEYLDLYRQRRQHLLRERRDSGARDSVSITFQLAFEQIRARSDAAADLLRLCAILAPEGVPESLVTAGADFLGVSLGSAARDNLTFRDTVQAANRLLQNDHKLGVLSLHKLIHDVLEDEMDPELKATWIERAVLTLDHVFPPVEFSNWTEIDRIFPHAVECGHKAIERGAAVIKAARLLYDCADYLLHRGNYSRAELLFDECFRTQAAKLGLEHADTLKTRLRLALMASVKGKAQEALDLLKALLPKLEVELGADHPDTLNARSIAAECIGELGDAKEAIHLFGDLQKYQEKSLGPLHPDTLMTRNNVASWTGDSGDPKHALDLFRELLPDVTSVRGPDHPDTLGVQENIALWTARSGNFEEAFKLFSVSLPRLERLVGWDHPITLRTVLNIAYNEAKQGQLDQALRRVHAIMKDVKRVLGNHPDVFTIRSYVAEWTLNLGQRDEAIRLFRELLQESENALGRDHPVTLAVLLNLSKALIECGRDDAAQSLLLDGLSRASARHGTDSPIARRISAWLRPQAK